MSDEAWSGAQLRGNDYSFLEAQLSTIAPSAPISIVIPTYNRASKLARTLAAITHLEAPSGGIEVVVSDDGSTDSTSIVVRAFEPRLNMTYVRRADRGHRLAEICNLGIRAARHDRVVLLQSDMLPCRRLLKSYGRWLDLNAPLLLIGMRRFTCADQLSSNEILVDPEFETRLPAIQTNNEMWFGTASVQDWRIQLYQETAWLKHERAPFRAVVGSNLAFRRSDALDLGGFCEQFQSWGGEDGEFGYRAFLNGYSLVPVSEAIAYHQEPPDGVNETNRREGFALSRLLRADLCALPPFRPDGMNKKYRVPKLAIGCAAGSQPALDLDNVSHLDAQIFHLTSMDGGRPESPVWCLQMLAAKCASPYLMVVEDAWPTAAPLPRNIFEVLDDELVDGLVIEHPVLSLLISTRSWNRANLNLKPSVKEAKLRVLLEFLSRYLVFKRLQI